MLKQCIFGLLLAATSFISSAEEAPSSDSQSTAYIVDNLYTFMHSGPSKNYRILGSVDAGTQIVLLSGEDNGYFKIRDDKDREGWVEAKFVTENAGIHQQFQALNNDMTVMQEELRQAEIELPQLQEQNKTLTEQNQALSKQIQTLKNTIESERNAKQTASAKEKRQLLTYGGAIAFIGLLLGIILTVVLSRRKRYDGWA